MSYAASLVLTFALEIPLYAMGLLALLGVRSTSGVRAGFAVNAFTHPVAFLVAVPLASPVWGYGATLAIVELGVWIAEATLLWAWLRRQPWTLLALSLVANGTSLSVGMLVLR